MFEIGIIIVVNLALHFKTLRYKFVSDDLAVFMNPPAITGRVHRLWARFVGAAKYQNSSYVPQWSKGLKIIKIKTEEVEHLFALCLHIIICLLIYMAFGKNNISFIAALLYATNPVNNQGTIWPAGRAYALLIIGLLSAYAFPYIAIFGIIFCTWFTAGFLAPLAFIGSEKWWLMFLVAIAWALNMRKFTKAVTNKAVSESFKEDARFRPRKLILAIKTFGFYLTLCIIPFRITFYHNFLQSCAGNSIMQKRAYAIDRYFMIGLTALITWIAYSLMHWNTIAWSMFAFMITILPFCNLRRANQEIAERFAALPNVFLMYFLAQVIIGYPYLITAFIIFYATRTYYTSMLYSDDYFLSECAIIEDRHAWWAWHCRAMKRWDTGSHHEALVLWVMAAIISPKEFKVLLNISTVLRLLKKDKEADEYLKRAEENIVEGQEEDAMRYIDEHRKGKLPILL